MRLTLALILLFATQLAAQSLLPPQNNLHSTLDTNKLLVSAGLNLEGNKITKDKIILRELEFALGDTNTAGQWKRILTKSQQNLMNRSLFNFVTFTDSVYDDRIDIHIKMIERWYIWPIPIIQYADRNVNVWWQTKDFSRLNLGVDLKVDNFRGRMEQLNIILQGGYDQTYAFKWSIPYLTAKQIMGMSTFAGVRLNHEIAYETKDNKLQHYRAEGEYARQQVFTELALTFRPSFNYQHAFFTAYYHFDFADTIVQLNPDFSQGQTTYNFFELKYLYKMDLRDYKPYPLNGYYFDAYLQKWGFGLFEDGVDMWSMKVAFDHYFQIHNRWYFAYNVTAKFTNNGYQPYFLSPALGYEEMTIRGYELYVVNGQKLGVIKSNLKFELVPKSEYDIKWIKTDKFGKIFYAFYANLFFDAGYAHDKLYAEDNPLNNQFLWGTGIGIDFVTYYDMVVRLEGSINKQGDLGFYVAFVAPI